MESVRKIYTTQLKLQMEGYEECLRNTLSEVYQEGTTFDMVIKAGKYKEEIYCHKMILASCSDFLHELLKDIEPGHQPMIILPDIEPDVIELILVFMYTGNLNINQSKVAEFEIASQLLQLKGLEAIMGESIPKDDVIPDTPILYVANVSDVIDEATRTAIVSPLLNVIDKPPASIVYVEPPVESQIPTTTLKRNTTHTYTSLRKRIKEAPNALEICLENKTRITNLLANNVAFVYKFINVEGPHRVNVEVHENPKDLEGSFDCCLCGQHVVCTYNYNTATLKFEGWMRAKITEHLKEIHEPLVRQAEREKRQILV